MAGILVRLAAPEELDLLVELDEDAGRPYASAGLVLDLPADHPFTIAERELWLDSARAQRAFLAVEAVENDGAGEPVGFAALGTVDGDGYLDQLSVRTRAMRRGIGRRLLKHAIGWAGQHAGGVLWLTTYDHLPYNRAFYESEGFVVVPEGACGADLAHHLAEQRRCLPAPEKRVVMRRG